jgi:dipeptidyl aminopeptidase/acylaminoacyl peptidase
MTPENDDRQVRDLLKRAAPPLPPDLREQALAAVTQARPRRHPRLVTVIAVILLLALLTAAVYAAVHYFLIEGTLQFGSSKVTPPGFRAQDRTDRYSEDLGWHTGGEPVAQLDVSPDGDDILYMVMGGNGWVGSPASISRAKADGSNPVDLTAKAGLSGANCEPTWSPDGRMIAFDHCDLVEGEKPCETGFHIWVMAADGRDARRVTPDGSPPTRISDWSPDGTRLLCAMGAPDEERTVTMDLWGRGIEVLPNVAGHAVWSPDGTMIASTLWQEKEVDGRDGIRRALLVTRADGTEPKVLVERFISDADAEAHVDIQKVVWRGFVPEAAHDLIDWKTDVQTYVGPREPVWSPGSDRIAFLAAMPFDPYGLNYRLQIEVWICDLATRELRRMTDDDEYQHTLVWR